MWMMLNTLLKYLFCCLSCIQAAAKRETEGVVGVFSKLISSAERCQAEVLQVNNTDTYKREISVIKT